MRWKVFISQVDLWVPSSVDRQYEHIFMENTRYTVLTVRCSSVSGSDRWHVQPIVKGMFRVLDWFLHVSIDPAVW